MADAMVGYTSKFQRGDGGSPETFTDVAEVVSISGPSMSRESVDLTHLNSPDSYMEFAAGMKDPGEVTLECRFLPNDDTINDNGLMDDFETGEARSFKIVFPDTSDLEFKAFVTAYEPSIGGVNDPVNLAVTLKVTGAPVLTKASA